MAILIGVLALLAFMAWWFLVRMPGESYRGAAATGMGVEELARVLERDVEALCGAIGERNVFRPKALARAADWIESSLSQAGYEARRQTYEVSGVVCANIDAELRGSGSGIVVVGAHYDSVRGSPGANDNGSGVAATLALARAFAQSRPERTLRFVFFVNEEPPWFQTQDMGSRRYARGCRERGEEIAAMISLETLGYFSDEPNSQRYPIRLLKLLYPDRGDFVGFVGNVGSRGLVRRALAVFRKHARIPSEGIAMWAAVPGVGWSDHWSFWQEGYDAIMVTDTAPFRYPHYHSAQDTPKKLRYAQMALVVEGLRHVVDSLLRVQH